MYCVLESYWTFPCVLGIKIDKGIDFMIILIPNRNIRIVRCTEYGATDSQEWDIIPITLRDVCMDAPIFHALQHLCNLHTSLLSRSQRDAGHVAGLRAMNHSPYVRVCVCGL